MFPQVVSAWNVCNGILLLTFGPWPVLGMDWHDFLVDADDSRATPSTYAPILKFHSNAVTYPMNAQTYLDNECHDYVEKSTMSHPCSNDKLDTLSNPTYFKVLRDDGQGNMDINYWSFYGRQYACLGYNFNDVNFGAHYGDWEHIQVHIEENILMSVTYFQHGDWYTAKKWEKEDNHPVVYVGEYSHGSYRSSNPQGITGKVGGGCGHFWDWRVPASDKDVLHTEMNLINVDTSTETWITNKIDVYHSKPYTKLDIEKGFDGCGRYFEKCEVAINMLAFECTGVKCHR